MKKSRLYEIIYWIGAHKHHETIEAKNYNDAYSYIYGMNGLPLSVDYVGWG